MQAKVWMVLLLVGFAGTVRAQEARQLFFEENYAAVIDLLAARPALSAEDAYLLGRAYQEQLRHDRATETFARADTTETRVLAAWGYSLSLLGRTPEALARYERAYRADSTDRRAAMPLARLYAEDERWQAVKAIFNRLLKDDPDNPYLHAQAGRAARALDSTDAALVHLERAHRLNPLSIDVPLQLSGVYLHVDSLISARRVLERALEQHPRHPTLWRRRGEIALEEQHYDAALDAFRKTLAYGDSTALNLRNLGAALYLNEAYAASLAPLKKAFRADSLHAMTAFYIGMVEKAEGRLDSALVYLRRAAARFGQSNVADVYEQVAETERHRGRYDAAIRADRLALQLNPQKTTVLFHLALLYDEYHADPNTALRQYELFLSRLGDDRLRGDLLVMQTYAANRIRELKEAQFFRNGPATAPEADSSGKQE